MEREVRKFKSGLRGNFSRGNEICVNSIERVFVVYFFYSIFFEVFVRF